MDFQKAHEIVESTGVIGVQYRGKPVWIKTLNRRENVAEVELLDGSEISKVVSVDELTEQ